MLAEEIREHLTGVLLPFWKGMRDDENGGFYGYMGYDLSLDRRAVKGCILNSRILWFFSNASMALEDKGLLEYARHACEFLMEACLDRENGGVFWSLTYDGKIADSVKHTYNQAFAIYALSSYFDASGDTRALALAWELYRVIEEKCRDEYGYQECFDRGFHPIDNEKLSENGVMAHKTMNTLLHVFEAYTELYRVTRAPEVAGKLKWILDVFDKKVYNREKGRLEVFFDRTWNSLIDLNSYGHDIEAAWLIDRGCELLGDGDYTARMAAVTREITENIYNRALAEDSLINEEENGVQDTTRVWWVQAEAVVGFINGYQKEPEKICYREAAERIWRYIWTCMVDQRDGAEWFWAVDQEGRPLEKPIVEPWKCPYHNGRMCFEAIRRTV